MDKLGKDEQELGKDVVDWPDFLLNGRRSCGLSQAKLAKMLGLSASYISKIERGALIPGDATAQAIKKTITTSTKVVEDDPLDLGAPPTNRDELRALAAKAVHWTLGGKLDPKRADAVTHLCQRAMGLFPEAPREDPLDSLPDPEMYQALQTELRAVEQRLVKAGWFKEPGHSKFRKAKAPSKPNEFEEAVYRDNPALGLASKGNGKPEPATAAPAQEWPEVE